MKKDTVKARKDAFRPLDEDVKPDIVKNLESCYGNALWDADRPFDIGDRDIHLLFDAINDGLFGNRLDRSVKKFTLKAELIPAGPRKYRGMERALAAFATGFVKGQPTELILVRHSKGANFYTAVCSLMHEMIHMYDYHFGPMGKQLDKYGAISMYNFNYPFVDPRTGKVVSPRTADELAVANILNAAATGFRDPDQLPNELIDKMKNPSKNDLRPRQYQLPGQLTRPGVDPDTGKMVPRARPLDKKYVMDPVDGFYDVHGDFFTNIAGTVNRMGFSITDVFSKDTPTRMTRTYESEPRPPENPAEAVCRFLKSDEHKGWDFRDGENWFVEIT